MAFLDQLLQKQVKLKPTVTNHRPLLSPQTIKEMFNFDQIVTNVKQWHFESEDQAWKEYVPDKATPTPIVTCLHLVTYNIWFSDTYLDVRMQELGKILAELNPDVIALQEVKPHILSTHILPKWEWIKDYYLSDVTGKTFVGYGVLLISKYPLKSLNIHPLPSRMGRKLVVAEYDTPVGTLAVSSTHLESYAEDVEWRAKQMKVIDSILGAFPHSVLLGDLNIVTESEVSTNLPYHIYSDAWSTLRPGECGGTTNNGRKPSSMKGSVLLEKEVEDKSYDTKNWSEVTVKSEKTVNNTDSEIRIQKVPEVPAVKKIENIESESPKQVGQNCENNCVGGENTVKIESQATSLSPKNGRKNENLRSSFEGDREVVAKKNEECYSPKEKVSEENNSNSNFDNILSCECCSSVRIDRVLVRSKKWIPKEIKRIGTEPIPLPKNSAVEEFNKHQNTTPILENLHKIRNDIEVLYPSDHFGLSTRICIK
eukprot:TRINITY_DN1443_c0_g1_i1.p1 TRINITY_DN1443_c0_g1~~TRINITY_DN1443_c0_g1_i1.p1  ORF type:complete len:482 (+),score=75.94 TRINITY_DN1443_c0_g1_i1:235-1680(+)